MRCGGQLCECCVRCGGELQYDTAEACDTPGGSKPVTSLRAYCLLTAIASTSNASTSPNSRPGRRWQSPSSSTLRYNESPYLISPACVHIASPHLSSQACQPSLRLNQSPSPASISFAFNSEPHTSISFASKSEPLGTI